MLIEAQIDKDIVKSATKLDQLYPHRLNVPYKNIMYSFDGVNFFIDTEKVESITNKTTKIELDLIRKKLIEERAKDTISLMEFVLDQENSKFIIWDQQLRDYVYDYKNEKYYDNLAQALERQSQRVLDFLEEDIQREYLDKNQKKSDEFLMAFLQDKKVYEVLEKIKPERKQ